LGPVATDTRISLVIITIGLIIVLILVNIVLRMVIIHFLF
jgi:hypothetical protein